MLLPSYPSAQITYSLHLLLSFVYILSLPVFVQLSLQTQVSYLMLFHSFLLIFIMIVKVLLRLGLIERVIEFRVGLVKLICRQIGVELIFVLISYWCYVVNFLPNCFVFFLGPLSLFSHLAQLLLQLFNFLLCPLKLRSIRIRCIIV